ncbi:MAG: methionyl-tRNA formyltransferase [Thermotogae bacterium]|nr:methionyl-tRNA formyltransferase [Thermotogota bacterium]
MRYVFFGSGELGRLTLLELVKHEKPLLVVSRPDKPKGRRRKLSPTPVKAEARRLGLRVETPLSPNLKDFIIFLQSLDIDFIFLADFGAILRKSLLQVPKIAPIGMHPSLLPRYRGAAPIEYAFFNCERITGVSVFVMEEKVDSGGILLQERIEIDPCNSIKGEVLPKFARLGGQLLHEAAHLLMEGSIRPIPQRGKPSYAPRLRSEDEFIRPQEGVMRTVGRINGLSPIPGARFVWERPSRPLQLKLLRARPYEEDTSLHVGQLHYEKGKDALLLGCSDGSVQILSLKVVGKARPLSPKEFANGYLRDV